MTPLLKSIEIINLYLKKGEQKNDEFPHISILEHGLKTAELASQKGYTNDIIIACLLLDIKYLIKEDIDKYLIRMGINNYIRLIINNTIQTKRYIVTINNEFRKNINCSSLLNLKYQGGLMDWNEAIDFEKDINYKTYINVYNLYNESVNSDVKLHDISYYSNMINKSISQNI
jgi:predicted HD phosphohydrolase